MSLSFGSLAKNIVSWGRLFIKSFLCSIDFMLKIAEFAKEKRSFSGFIISQRFDFFKLSPERRLDLKKHVKVVVNISNNTKKISIFSSNFPLGSLKVTKSQVSLTNLLVNVIEVAQQAFVGLVRGGLCSHDFISGRSCIINFIQDVGFVLVNLLRHFLDSILVFSLQISHNRFLLNIGFLNVFTEFSNFSLSLLIELHLSMSSTSSLIKTLTKLLNFSSQIRSLPFSLGTGLAFCLKLFLHLFNTALEFLNVLLHFCNKRLFIIKLGSNSRHILFFPCNGILNLPLCPLKVCNHILSHFQFSLNLSPFFFQVASIALLFVKSPLKLIKS